MLKDNCEILISIVPWPNGQISGAIQANPWKLTTYFMKTRSVWERRVSYQLQEPTVNLNSVFI